jgi:CheY-like chemotaxis protein
VGKDIMVIALTGWGQEDDRRKSVEAGFNGHLVKPVDYDKLLNLLSTVTDDAVNPMPMTDTIDNEMRALLVILFFLMARLRS